VKDILLIREYARKDGTKGSEWCKCGVAFDPNKDGSVNITLYMFPGVTFQIRDQRKKENGAAAPTTQAPSQEPSPDEVPF
jgi:hypothetical protein